MAGQMLISSTVSQCVADVVDSMQYLQPLSNRDLDARMQAMDTVSQFVEQCLEGYGSPLANGFLNGMDKNSLLQAMLSGFVRLSLECPYDDIREHFESLLAQVQERSTDWKVPRPLHTGPSHFIPSSEVIPVTTADEQTRNIFMEAFLQNNRLDHVSQVMGYHPEYLRIFLSTQDFLLRKDGPLPLEYRHYIAIMAAARHECTYLVKLHEQEFLVNNGDAKWLKGIAYAPKKLQNLYEFNKILAHRPWLISKDHMMKLLKGPEPWSLSELMQAIILLTHFHSMCSFVYGCGISAELDIEGCTCQPASSDRDDWNGTNNSSGCYNHAAIGDEEAGVGLDDLMRTMSKLREASSEEASPEEMLKRFHSVEHQSAQISVPSTKNAKPKADIVHYVIDPNFSYIDFASRNAAGDNDIPVFRARDYSWDVHGYSMANRLYAEVGSILDEKYNLAHNLTYYTMGDNREVDTSSFRRAIWNYIHSLYGIRHDDYDYAEVNQLLQRNLKQYIKTQTCYPERLEQKDFDGVMKEFKNSEKVHVNLMLMEARQQAELLYALRALNRYLT